MDVVTLNAGVRYDQQYLYGGNQKLGYQYFIDKGFDVVVLLHGDGQYAPEILSHLFRIPVDGKPMRRASTTEVEDLLD